MATIMQSVTKIKHGGKYIPAYTPFEVEDNEVDELVKKGCHILRRSKPTKKLSALDTKKTTNK